MQAHIGRWLALLVLAAELPGLAAQEAAPSPPATGAPETLPAPTLTQPRPPAYVLPPIYDPLRDAVTPEPRHLDPLLDRPGVPLTGWFVNVDVGVLDVRFRNQLAETVIVSPARIDTVRFPGVNLDPTASPRLELGYRMINGNGEFFLSGRFLSTDGQDSSSAAPLASTQKDRLSFQVFDLGYRSWEFSLWPECNMRWVCGGRVSVLYYDARLNFLNAPADPGTVLGLAETNHFYGFGVFGGLDLSHKTPVPGLEVFGRAEVSDNYCRIKQTYTERLVPSADGTFGGFGGTRDDNGLGVPMANGQVGLSYTVPEWNYTRFLIGYTYETWWQVGRNSGAARGQLDMQGLFLRAELNF
jgi:hypothetical protein